MAEDKQIRRAVYPGTFDPVTNGHVSLIERASQIFDELIVAVVTDSVKDALFSFEERREMMEKTVAAMKAGHKGKRMGQVTIMGFDGLLADFVKKVEARAIVRGLRAVSDFEYEFQMALMNRKMARDVETVFLMPALSWVYLSSSLVKDVALNGGDIDTLVPRVVSQAFKAKLKSKS